MIKHASGRQLPSIIAPGTICLKVSFDCWFPLKKQQGIHIIRGSAIHTWLTRFPWKHPAALASAGTEARQHAQRALPELLAFALRDSTPETQRWLT